MTLFARGPIGDVRLGSIGSWVGPDVTIMRLPESAVPRRKMLSAAATISFSGSAMRPKSSFAALRHLAGIGSNDANAVGGHLRQIARRCFGRPHADFIAGAIRIGLPVASRTAVARSSRAARHFGEDRLCGSPGR